MAVDINSVQCCIVAKDMLCPGASAFMNNVYHHSINNVAQLKKQVAESKVVAYQ